MAEYIYVLYEKSRDDYGYSISNHDLEVVYGKKSKAQAEARSRNSLHNNYRRTAHNNYELNRADLKADWDALVAAGLRTGTGGFGNNTHEFREEKIWFVEEIEII